MAPGGLVTEIVPEDATVMADVEVPAERIGNVRAGQPVRNALDSAFAER